MYAARRKTGHKTTRAPRWWVWLAYEAQEYGGPEEGGWWYDTTTPARDDVHYCAIPCRDKAQALRKMRALRHIIELRGYNHGKRKPWSAASRGDWLTAEYASRRPHTTPTRRPHYE